MKKRFLAGPFFVWRGGRGKACGVWAADAQGGKRNVPGCRAVIWAGRKPWRGWGETEEHRDNSPGKLMFSRLNVS